jgi:hypothetical protein
MIENYRSFSFGIFKKKYAYFYTDKVSILPIFIFFFFLFPFFHSPKTWGLTHDLINRYGVGFSQRYEDIGNPILAFKMHADQDWAYGAHIGLNTSSTTGSSVLGGRIYKMIFDEPLLNFYASGSLALLSKKFTHKYTDSTTTTTNGVEETSTELKSITESKSGMQIDFTLGSEFHFSGLESIGFNLEFGLGMNTLDDSKIKTIGNHILSAGIFFYL